MSRKDKYQEPKPVAADPSLAVSDDIEWSEIDEQAAAEGQQIRRAFHSSRGLDVIGKVVETADRLMSNTKGRTERKPKVEEEPEERRMRLKALRRARIRKRK